ncbi:probable C-mannosyltransferase DPY19L1 [Haliotis rubra]|uniref:probable C-mannosyltransferase DPY19L1 n=1 Tax=Haliotis rubra TaxID=36100 RepID=UPI001EE55452|nr:probable C-mannosyltransferase DPY19L1 [Haliotis rubra]
MAGNRRQGSTGDHRSSFKHGKSKYNRSSESREREKENGNSWGIVYKLFLVAVAIGIAVSHRNHIATMFEKDRHFSHLSTLERELAFRTEMGLYYSYFKTLIHAPSFMDGLNEIMYDNVTEYPQTINVLKRFNLYPEVVLSIGYRIFEHVNAQLNRPTKMCWQVNRGEGKTPVQSCEGLGEPSYFYVESAFALNGMMMGIFFLFGTYLSDSMFGGILTVACYFFNHGEATRVQWTPPLRESFAYPFLVFQMLLVTFTLRSKSPNNTHSVAIALASVCFMLPWQIFKTHTCTFRFTQIIGNISGSPSGGHHYQWNVLPFGISTAPWLFTRVTKPISSFLHSRGVTFESYIDDCIQAQQDPNVLQIHREFTIRLLKQLGWLLNYEKSELTPTRRLQFIGAIFDTEQAKLFVPQDRWTKIQRLVPLALDHPRTLRQWQELLGVLTSAQALTYRGQLQLRPLQLFLRPHLQTNNPQVLIRLPRELRPILRWWLNVQNVCAGVSLVPFSPTHQLFVDASLEGWGAHFLQHQVAGQWSSEDKSLHINILEFKAVLLAIQHWAALLKMSHLLIQSDNSTVVWYINHLGSTGSAALLQWTFRFYLLIDSLNIVARARHIPGTKNVIADALSRSSRPSPTEWQLLPKIFRTIIYPISRPSVDLFATRFNSQLPRFVSPIPDPLAWDHDALAIPWEGLNAYAFPPPALLHKVIQKILLTNKMGLAISYLLLFGNEMLLTSFYASCLISMWIILFLRPVLDKLHFKIVIMAVQSILLAIGTVCSKIVVGKLLNIADDAHIGEIFRSKFSDFKNFHTMLYTCSKEFDFIEEITIWKLTWTLLLPCALIVFLTAVFFILRSEYSQWKSPVVANGSAVHASNTAESQGRNRPDAELVYHLFQQVSFATMAIMIMRLKLFWTPHLCLLTSLLASRKYFGWCGRNEAHFAVLAVVLAGMAYTGIQNLQQQWSIMGEFSNYPMEDLVDWINDNTPKNAVFAGPMPTMATIKLCTHRPIVNHPHYEDAGLRERTKVVYSIFSRKSGDVVVKGLKELEVDYIIYENSWCVRRTKEGCSMPEIWDTEDIENRGKTPYCEIVRDRPEPYFKRVYMNNVYQVLKLA